MRILLTTDTVGGVWTFTRELTLGLLAAGQEVALVSFGREPLPEHKAAVQQILLSSPRHFTFAASDAPLEWMEQNPRVMEGKPVLQEAIRRIRPDVVHSSQFCWGALEVGVPVVVTAHSDVLSWAESCRPDGLEDSDWLRAYVRWTTQGLATASIVTSPTHAMLDSLCQHFPVTGPTKVVPNGRDLPALEGPVPVRKLRALTAGRLWDEAKGLGLLAEGDWPMPVVVAGESRFEQGAALFTGVESLGLLGEADLLAAMWASAIYLGASLYEPFGLAAVEAALCGCAVVCRDLPSLREVWGDAALYFRNAEELRAVLRGLAASPTLLSEQQTKSQRRAARYSRQSMTAHYLDLYQQVAQGVARQEVAHA